MLLNLARILVVALGLGLAYAHLLRFERQIIGRLALGGNPRWGTLWPLVDVLRALTKPDEGAFAGIRPGAARLVPRLLPPLLSVAATTLALALIPAGPAVRIGGIGWSLRVAQVDANVLTLFVLNWVALGGMLLGAWRAGAAPLWHEASAVVGLALCYALVALCALLGVFMLSGSLSLEGIVRAQVQGLPYALYQPLGLALCAVALLAGGRRLPIRSVHEGNALLTDLALQHAGRSLALYHLAEYLHLLWASALIATLYLAGWRGPGADGVHWLMLKTLLVACALLWLRNGWLAQRRLALDGRGWLVLLALAVFNAVVTALVLAWRQ